MNKLLLIISTFLSVVVSAQPIMTDAANKQIQKWDSTYSVESKFFRADYNYETWYYCSVKKENKLIAEYFRHDDTSFLFVKYDTAGGRLQRGLIKLCKEIFDSAIVEIPDYNLDVNGSKSIYKDTILYDYSYRKNGIWWERDSNGMIWKGNYSNGLREGKWQEGVLVCCNETSERINDAMYDLIRPFISHVYEKGIEINQLKDSSFWPKVKGGWYFHHTLKPNRLVFEKISESMDLSFKDENLLLFKFNLNRLKNNKTLSTGKWNQNKGLLEINTDNKLFIFQVVRLDDQYLILEAVN